MSADDEVRSASNRFYSALNSTLGGDAGAMAAAWSHSATVTTMHPIGGREVGWENAGETWPQFAKLASGGRVELDGQIIQVDGNMAYEVGYERGHVTLAGRQVTVDHRVTNVYRREAGAWKMVHHHADVSPAMQDLLRELQAGS